MRIGIDFDNTIVCYDAVFYRVAKHLNLIPANLTPSKSSVRDYLRSINNEKAWTELQGYVYGTQMNLALPFPGVSQFFQRCFERQIDAIIISHKTKHPYSGPKHDLHLAAQKWLSKQSFTGNPAAHFETTLEEKLSKISIAQCTLFIDDLPELLAERNFPSHVQKVLFDPNHLYSDGDYIHMFSWQDISNFLFPE